MEENSCKSTQVGAWDMQLDGWMQQPAPVFVICSFSFILQKSGLCASLPQDWVGWDTETFGFGSRPICLFVE